MATSRNTRANKYKIGGTDLSQHNFVVPKENILRYSKTLYERLQSIISYEPERYAPWSKNVCGETYILERLFYFMWTNNLIESD